jgi:DNA-binding transcriptional ArsR family regulator
MSKINPKIIALQNSATNATRLLKAMANVDRLMLLCQIARAEMSVGEIEEATSIHQPTLSQQLGVLRDEGLVDTRRDGKKIYYSISNDSVLALMNVLYKEVCGKSD